MDLKRSWMFVPGHRQKMIDKALGLQADAIMLDIEDGVAPNEKDTARKMSIDGERCGFLLDDKPIFDCCATAFSTQGGNL